MSLYLPLIIHEKFCSGQIEILLDIFRSVRFAYRHVITKLSDTSLKSGVCGLQRHDAASIQ